MKITLTQIRQRTEQLNRELDLKIADRCSRVQAPFTMSYILTTRSTIAKRSFERLINAGVLIPCGTGFKLSPKRYEEFKHGDATPRQGSTTKVDRRETEEEGV